MKIRTAIFGVYVTASALGFAALVALVLRDVRFRYVESMRRTLSDTATFLGVFVTQGPTDDGWSTKLSALPSKAELLHVFACDATGRVIFDSAHDADLGRVYQWASLNPPKSDESSVASNVSDGELQVAVPVYRNRALLGWVGVGRPLARVAAGISKARTELIWSLLSIAGIMVAAGWWISSKLTHSIERLTDYALAVRDGRQAVPPASRAQEVAALGRAFEEMRVALEGKAYVERYTQALAHEFKAPLSSIRGAAELLAENPPEPERTRFTDNLRAESNRLQMIVDRLLELAALESRRVGALMTDVDLGVVVQDVHAGLHTAASARQVKFSVSVPAAVWVRGEKFLLEQSLRNLVQNAIEFTPVGGTIVLSLRADEVCAVIAVEDTGPGVPDYALEKIFDRFYSLPRPDTGRKSSGLGLSIVREIARLHGGNVSLVNRREGGVRATLSFPVLIRGH